MARACRIRLTRCCVVVLALMPWVATAAQHGAGAPPRWHATVSLPEVFEADVDDGDAGLEIDRVGVEVGYSVPWAGGLLGYRLRQEQSAYRADAAIFTGAEIAEVDETGIGASYRRRDGPWRWLASADLVDAVAERADFGDGTYLSLAGGGLVAVSEGLELGLLLRARGGIERGASLTLIPLIEYRIDERNRIGLVRAVEPAIGYSHRFAGGNEWYLGWHLATRQFRLDEQTAVIDRERGWRIGGIFRVRPGFSAEAFAGRVSRSLDLWRDGSEVDQTEVERATMFGLGARFRF